MDPFVSIPLPYQKPSFKVNIESRKKNKYLPCIISWDEDKTQNKSRQIIIFIFVPQGSMHDAYDVAIGRGNQYPIMHFG